MGGAKNPHPEDPVGRNTAQQAPVSIVATYGRALQYDAAGADTPSRTNGPSSVTQLPILTALHARFPTLFGIIIHQPYKKVNREKEKFTNSVYCAV